MPFNQIQRSGVTTCDSFPRQILKVCVLGRVEAWYWKPNIVFRQTTNISPVRTCLIITCKSRICKFWIEYYSSRVTTPNSTWYSTPNITWIPSFFWNSEAGLSYLPKFAFNHTKSERVRCWSPLTVHTKSLFCFQTLLCLMPRLMWMSTTPSWPCLWTSTRPREKLSPRLRKLQDSMLFR